MDNPVTHWQILTKRPQELEKFYEALFGWKFSADNPLGYKIVDRASSDGIGGGIWPISQDEGSSKVQLFVRVNDVNGSVKAAEALGARIIIPLQTLPGGDQMAVMTDPDGIPFTMFKSAGSVPL